MALRNPTQNFDNATMLDAVLLEISIFLKTSLPWLNSAYGNTQTLFKLRDKKEYVYPAIYVGGVEYLDLLPDGHLGSYSFFKVNDPKEIEYNSRQVNRVSVDVDLIFWFDLKAVFPNDTGRNIENVESEISKKLRVMTLKRGSFSYSQTYKESKNIFKDYSIKEIKTQHMMHPYGALMYKTNISYFENC